MSYSASFEAINTAMVLGEHRSDAKLADTYFTPERRADHPDSMLVIGDKIEGAVSCVVPVDDVELGVNILSRVVLLKRNAHDAVNAIPGHSAATWAGPRGFILTKVDFKRPNGGLHTIESLSQLTHAQLGNYDDTGLLLGSTVTTDMPNKSKKRPEAVDFHTEAIKQIGITVPIVGHLAVSEGLDIGENLVQQSPETLAAHVRWLVGDDAPGDTRQSLYPLHAYGVWQQ